MTISLSDIQAAREPAGKLARVTPLLSSRHLSEELGGEVRLKAEMLQRTGSFKVRGAATFIASLDAEARRRGVIAASAGNHAQGVAVAAAVAGVPSRVVMPIGTALPKERATAEYGAEIVLYGSDLGEASEHAIKLAEQHGWTYVPPFDDPRIIAGQGTLGLEMLEQAPDVELVVVPVGGGGLAGGIALAMKSLRPSVSIIGVQAAAVDSAVRSHRRAEPVAAPRRWTLADGCAVPRVGDLTLPLLNRYVDEIVAVSEEWISAAMVLLLERTKLVVEGAGALGIAALLSGKIRLEGRRTVVLLSGGNIDINLIARTVEHGLARAGRYVTVVVWIPDRPGQLARVLSVCSDHRVNVLNVEHHRSAPGLPIGAVEVELMLETRDMDHADATAEALVASGFGRIASEPGVIRLADRTLVVEP